MRASERAYRIGMDFTGVLPRARAALRSSGDWKPLSPLGARQLGEVFFDELALAGFTLTAPPPTLERTPASCEPVAEELSTLGVDGANVEPDPLAVTSIRRRRFGQVRYEQLTFEHDPHLPESLAAEGLDGPARAVVHLCRIDEARRPWLVWVHGAGQGQPIDLLFSRAQQLQRKLGLNIALPVQPGCGVRRSRWPAYPNMDPVNNVAGMMRAVSEVRALVRWLRPQASAIAVSGVSMGSPVAGLVSHLENIDTVTVLTPIFGLNEMIAAHLGRWGPSARDTIALLRAEPVARMASAVDYHSVAPSAPASRRLIVGAWHDRMALREPAQVLHERWNGELFWHKGSHVGHLFARDVQEKLESFLRSMTVIQ